MYISVRFPFRCDAAITLTLRFNVGCNAIIIGTCMADIYTTQTACTIARAESGWREKYWKNAQYARTGPFLTIRKVRQRFASHVTIEKKSNMTCILSRII